LRQLYLLQTRAYGCLSGVNDQCLKDLQSKYGVTINKHKWELALDHIFSSKILPVIVDHIVSVSEERTENPEMIRGKKIEEAI